MATVLLVDDEMSVREMVSEVIRQCGHKVVTASSVTEAKGYFTSQEIDLVVTDLVMPEQSGIDLILEFKQIKPNVKVLAISGGGGITGRFDYLPIASLVGAGAVLKKPFSINEFSKKLEELLSVS
ncbi:hypothetical protein MNBD_GAMMA18-1070 [hydrothermal vent metagenome]|uniref:Response regulatory domain-containing protein n=1 Tax=hydrothermal vent metagenome TaxID=652676 RepID=A0A3B0ZCQ0_9ZZZZ